MEYILPNGTEVIPYMYCYPPKNILAGGLWSVSAPLYLFSLPVVLWQMVLVWGISHTLAFLLKPFRQPKVIAEILTGILLGPTLLSKIKLTNDEGGPANLGELLIPTQSFRQIDFFGHLGALFFLFLVGVEFDVRMITKMRKKVIIVSTANMFLPLIVVILIVLAMDIRAPSHIYHLTHGVFIGLAMVVTAFPILVRLLSELKLLNNEVGQIVLPSAVVADLMAWALLTMTLVLPAYSGDPRTKALRVKGPMRFASIWIILCGIGFVLICWSVFRPIMFWMVRRTPAGHPVSDVFILIIVTSLLVAELVSEAIGLHAVLGAFIFGLMVPQGPLSVGLREKLEEFVVNILLPLFFASTGFKTDLSKISMETEEDAKILLGIAIMSLIAVAVKVGSSMLIARYYSLPASHGLSVGLLMSAAKGPIEMIILNIGKQRQVFDGRTYAILVLGSVLTTSAIAPTVAILNRTTRSRISYKRRNLQRCRPDKELRMVACVHTARNVPSIISVLQLSNPTKNSPISVYTVHLMELATRATAMRIVRETGLSKLEGQLGYVDGTMMLFEQNISAFESYEQHAGGVCVQQLTALSPYSSMHEDIFKIAEERCATLLILPFHKQQSMTTGEFEEINPFIRGVNQSVLADPPCSIGILVDRGLSRAGRFPFSQQLPQNVAVLFFGGPDDREALSYTWRMADNSEINLMVVRFILNKDTTTTASSPFNVAMTAIREDSMQRLLDDESVNEFRVRFIGDENVMYTEKIVNNAEDTIEAIRAMNDNHTMYVVGKGQGMESSPLLRGLMEWAEYPELGPIGDMLVSSDFSDRPASVLIVQQYITT